MELLQTYAANAKSDELRAKYPSYGEQERHKGEPPTFETADYAEFPTFTAYRSDLASLGRRGIVKPAYLAYLRREHASGHASYYGVMIWVLVELELWLQANA